MSSRPSGRIRCCHGAATPTENAARAVTIRDDARRRSSCPPTTGCPGERLSTACPPKRTFKSFQAHKMTDHAASLTYYTMTSALPRAAGDGDDPRAGGHPEPHHRRRELRARPAPTRRLPTAIQLLAGERDLQVGRRPSFALVISVLISLNGAPARSARPAALNVVNGVEMTAASSRPKSTTLIWTVVVIVLAIVLSSAGRSPPTVREDSASGPWPPTSGPTCVIVALVAAILIYAIVYAFAPRHQSTALPLALARRDRGRLPLARRARPAPNAPSRRLQLAAEAAGRDS